LADGRVQDFVAEVEKRRLKYDVQHQISRLRMAKGMSDAEADAIFATFAEIEGYEETVEVSAATRPTLTRQVALLSAASRRWYHAYRQRAVSPSTKCAGRYSDHLVVDAALQRE
jgi:hypothetical protein